MNLFSYRKFQDHIIITSVRWYCKYGISYRDLEEMMKERHVDVDHSTLNRWVLSYATKFAKNLNKHRKNRYNKTWYVDETYVKIKGKNHYLYRAINKQGETLDFYLSARRNEQAARHFLGTALKKLEPLERPKIINTDKDAAYPPAIANLKKEGLLSDDLKHRMVKYLNNRIECDHGKLKRLIKPMLGFKSLHSARATIAGFELMRMFKKGQFTGAENVHDEMVLITKSLRIAEKIFPLQKTP
jgi:IS6 family transposase